MILMTEEQADRVKGKYGSYSALEPIQVVEGFALPVDIIDNVVFASVKELLESCPQVEVTLIEPPEIIE